MKIFSYPELLKHQRVIREFITRKPHISPICSDLAYGISAAVALCMHERIILIIDEDCYGVFLKSAHAGKEFLLPLELFWLFGTHVYTPSVEKLQSFLHKILREVPGIRGIQLSGLTITEALALHSNQNRSTWIISDRQPTSSVLVDIEGGVESLMARFSANRRKNFRKTLRRVESARISTEYLCSDIDPGSIWNRLLALEQRSWKFQRNESVFQHQDLFSFYRGLIGRYASRNELRVLFLRKNEKDIAYIFGVVIGNTFRGFQTSFSHTSEVIKLGVGNFAHLKLIELLSAEGVTTYDMGMTVRYKEHWSRQKLFTYNMRLLKP